jgi:hypothetical protein
MTSFTRPRSRSRDIQDLVERGIWGSLEYIPGAGASMTVRGTGTLDQEVPLFNIGYGFNLPADANAEMIMLSLNSDVNDKMVLASIPRNLQHPWAEGTGGVQHPTDPSRRLEFNQQVTHLTDGNFAIGPNSEILISVSGGNISIQLSGNIVFQSSGPMTIQAPSVDIQSTTLTHNGTNVGDNHTHSGVQVGTGNTGGPQ